MTEQQQVFIKAIEEDLAKSSPFERVGFDAGEPPSVETIHFYTEQTCEGIEQCLPPGEKRDILILKVRLATEQAILELTREQNNSIAKSSPEDNANQSIIPKVKKSNLSKKGRFTPTEIRRMFFWTLVPTSVFLADGPILNWTYKNYYLQSDAPASTSAHFAVWYLNMGQFVPMILIAVSCFAWPFGIGFKRRSIKWWGKVLIAIALLICAVITTLIAIWIGVRISG